MFCKSQNELDLLIGARYRVLCRPKCCGCIDNRSIDFIVAEDIVLSTARNTTHSSLLLVLYKRNLDTQKALYTLAKKLGIGLNCLKIYGLKDANATTIQYLELKPQCTPLIPKDKTVLVKENRGNKLLIARRIDAKIVLHLGNRFVVRLRPVKCSTKLLEQVSREIDNKPIPNYYGYQRFGSRRPSSHIVAYLFLAGFYGLALKEHINSPYPDETIENIMSRLEWQQGKNIDSMKKLTRRGISYEMRTLHCLQKGFIKQCAELAATSPCIVLNSIQSWLFNQYLSLRIQEGYSFETPIDGEKKEGRHIVAPVPGRGVRLAGQVKELYNYLLDQYGMKIEDLYYTKKCWLKGYWRRIWIKTLITARTLGEHVVLSFSLPRGSYATTVLREVACSPLCIT